MSTTTGTAGAPPETTDGPDATDTPATPSVSRGDAEQWREVTEWKSRAITHSTPLLGPLTDGIAEVRAAVTAGLRTIPGVTQIDDGVHEVLHQLASAGAGAGAATLRRETVFADYRAQGYDVTDFKHIRELEVDQIQAVLPRLDLGYTSFAAVQGGITSFLTTSGAAAVAGGAGGAGIGSLPGIAVIAASLTGDALLTVAACTRAVAHVAAYYGYDVTRRSEQVLALAILAVGLSGDAEAPEAYDEVATLITTRTRDKEKRKRQQKQLRRLGHAVHQRLLSQIGQRELAQLVPVVGIGFGAVLSARLLGRVVDSAEHLYRERFLHDRYDLPFGQTLPFDPATYRPFVDIDDDGDEDEIFAGA